jgi:hypothetical protein
LTPSTVDADLSPFALFTINFFYRPHLKGDEELLGIEHGQLGAIGTLGRHIKLEHLHRNILGLEA